MNELTFEYQNAIKRLKLSKVNFFLGGSQSGKTTLIEFIEKGFLGQDKSFLFERSQIMKNQFSVIKIKELQTIEDELKLTAKTNLARIVKSSIQNIDLYDLNIKLNELLIELTNSIDYELMSLKDEFGDVIVNKIESIDLSKFVKDNFIFVNEEKVSNSMKKDLLIWLNLKMENKKFRILLVDDFDNDLDMGQMIKIINLVENERDLLFFVFTKSAILCEFFCKKYPIYLIDRNLEVFDEIIQEYLDGYIEKGDELMLLVDNEIIVLRESFFRVVAQAVLLYYSCKDKRILIDFFEKNKIYDRNVIRILENFEKMDSKQM